MASSLLLVLLHHSPPLELLLACFFFLFLFKYLHLKPNKSKRPTNWPIVGMFPTVLVNLDNIHGYLTDLLRECGCTFYFRGPWFCGMNFLVTCDPANVIHVFNSNFANYPKGGEFSEIFDILGDGIFNADDESWRSQRRKAQILTGHSQFRSFVATCSREKVEGGLVPLLGRLAERDAVVDLQDVFLRLTFDMTCSLVFGVDPGCLSIEFPTVPFARAMDDAMEALYVRHIVPTPCWKLMRWLNIGKEKKLAAGREVMDEFVAQSIARSRGHGGRSLLTSYVNNEEQEYDDKYIRDTTVNFMLAGRDTTGTGLAWFFWLLSKNPKAESKILEELGELLKKKEAHEQFFPVVFDTEEVAKLVYLHAALCEALRLYPPVPFEHKCPVREDVLPSGERAPPGRRIMFSTYSMGRMEGVWGEDCAEFRPERWISERGGLRHEPAYKFMSFNCGPRTCIGKDVAFSQMKAVAAAVVCNFRFEAVEGHVVKPKPSVILQMKDGWKVRIKKKNHYLQA
ncbi:alkane hydroxylase MAH1-like [Iris pallida]|uniref:noroxomaritidine synthase n=1 Tax=Iris pallida TaxID=29817 RepID=A0AAX6HQV3_IRIPA|nr:alkane hydroxylase MAH1-like [Iris pallida]